MAKPVFLHIGMPKTGTSSIQQYLRNNRSVLKRHGFIVPITLGRLNHENVALYALDDKSKATVRQRHELLSVPAIKEFRRKLLADFSEETAEWTGSEAIVITGEHMSMLCELDEFDRLRQLLG